MSIKNVKPASEYKDLLRQFCALKQLANSLESELEYHRKRNYETSEEKLKSLEASLESERDMNAHLTDEVEALTSQIKVLEHEKIRLSKTRSDRERKD